jgi:hypothetical protein
MIIFFAIGIPVVFYGYMLMKETGKQKKEIGRVKQDTRATLYLLCL